MHKGPLYELWQEYRTFCGEYPYPQWAPASWTIHTASWAGTASGLVPATPLHLIATGINASLECCYECPLFDSGGGVYATLQLFAFLAHPTAVNGWVGGDWGVHGNLPRVANYHLDTPFNPLSKGFGSSGTAPEAYLRPVTLGWDPTPY